jgi:hypothetical protein
MSVRPLKRELGTLGSIDAGDFLGGVQTFFPNALELTVFT